MKIIASSWLVSLHPASPNHYVCSMFDLQTFVAIALIGATNRNPNPLLLRSIRDTGATVGLATGVGVASGIALHITHLHLNNP